MKTPKFNKNQLAAAGIFSAVSGALALYLSKKPALRKKMMHSGSPAGALKTFGEHVQKDSSSLAKSFRDFAKSHMPGRTDMKRAAKHAKKETARQLRAGGKRAAKAMKRAAEALEKS